MSAETAWKVARDGIATQLEVAGQAFSLPSSELAGKALTGAAAALRSLPMPPAFAAAVEAEVGEVREMLEAAIKAEKAMDYAHNQDEGTWGLGALHEAEALVCDAAVKARALLSRMEGKR